MVMFTHGSDVNYRQVYNIEVMCTRGSDANHRKVNTIDVMFTWQSYVNHRKVNGYGSNAHIGHLCESFCTQHGVEITFTDCLILKVTHFDTIDMQRLTDQIPC